MATGVYVNPILTTNAEYSFLLQTDGWVAGTVQDDPGLRYQLDGCQITSGTSINVWGGIPLAITVPAAGQGGATSLTLPQATPAASTGANINGWTVLNQSSNGLLSAVSNCPVFLPGMTVNFIRPGCNLILYLPVNPAAVASLAGAAPNVDLYWNFTDYYIDTTGTGILPVQFLGLNSNSKIPVYTSATGAVNWGTGSAVALRI